MPLFEYKCRNGHLTEELQKEHTCSVECSICKELAYYKVVPPVVKLEGITGSFPGAYYAWEKKRKQKMEQEAKQNS